MGASINLVVLKMVKIDPTPPVTECDNVKTPPKGMWRISTFVFYKKIDSRTRNVIVSYSVLRVLHI